VYLVALTITGPPTFAEEWSRHNLNDRFHELACPNNSVEHVHVREMGTAAEISIFLLATSQRAADMAAFRICERTLQMISEATNWHLTLGISPFN
jgi:hypothetical protein